MIDMTNFFITIRDPRVDRTKKHSLCKIIVLAVYAIIAGANDWEDIEEICIVRKNELEKIIDLENEVYPRMIHFKECLVDLILKP